MTISKKPKLLGAGHADNFQTPPEALDDVIPYIEKTWLIWECAAGKRNLSKGLTERGISSIESDITDIWPKSGPDSTNFLEMSIPTCDMILTNPPFSLKHKFLARAIQIDKPFAFLLPITVFDSHERRKLFAEHNIQFIMPDGRYNFETPSGKGKSAWFYTIWVCYKLDLPSTIVYRGFDKQLTMEAVNERQPSSTNGEPNG